MSNDQERADRLTYDSYKLAETQAFIDAGNLFWFDSNKALRKRRGSNAPEDFFTGPWWVIKPWLTQEAIDWVEVAGNSRYTFTDWQRMQREQRAQAAQFDAEQSDPLRMLEYERELHDRRGEFIAQARANGASWAQIQAANGISRMTANTLLNDYLSPEVVPEPMPDWERYGYDGPADLSAVLENDETPF